MKKEIKKWRSPSLGKKMELRIYGESGTPVLAIPTRGTGSKQWEEKGMLDAVKFQLENGFNQFFCIESTDEESFFNADISPSQRIVRHIQYESYIIEEVIPFIKDNSSIDFIIIAGMDMGGYHAINIGLKHPSLIGKAIGLSGVYDISHFMGDYYDENIYYNNPVDYLPNLNNEKLLDQIREADFRLTSFEKDTRKEVAYQLDEILKAKLIDHHLDVWQEETDDEWELWPEMLKLHIV